MHSLIYSIWHTFNFSHLTKNIVKDFIPNNSHGRCHTNIFWFLFLFMIFFLHLQPLVPYLFPCCLYIIKELNSNLLEKFNPMFLSKRLVIVFLVFFSHKFTNNFVFSFVHFSLSFLVKAFFLQLLGLFETFQSPQWTYKWKCHPWFWKSKCKQTS